MGREGRVPIYAQYLVYGEGMVPIYLFKLRQLPCGSSGLRLSHSACLRYACCATTGVRLLAAVAVRIFAQDAGWLRSAGGTLGHSSAETGGYGGTNTSCTAVAAVHVLAIWHLLVLVCREQRQVGMAAPPFHDDGIHTSCTAAAVLHVLSIHSLRYAYIAPYGACMLLDRLDCAASGGKGSLPKRESMHSPKIDQLLWCSSLHVPMCDSQCGAMTHGVVHAAVD